MAVGYIVYAESVQDEDEEEGTENGSLRNTQQDVVRSGSLQCALYASDCREMKLSKVEL